MPNIVVREMKFDFEKPLKMVFVPDQPEYSYMGIGLSLIFPYVEPFVIRAMNDSVAYVKNDQYKKDIDKFCRQEAQHTKQHKKVNEVLKSMHYSKLDWLERYVARHYQRLNKKSLKFRLAYTVGFEAYASAAALLTHSKDLMSNAEGLYADVWRWHLYEELEHSAATFDVYDHLYTDSYRYKVLVGVYSIYHLHKLGIFIGVYLLLTDYKQLLKNHGGVWGIMKRLKFWIGTLPELIPMIIAPLKRSYQTAPESIHDSVNEELEQYNQQAARIL